MARADFGTIITNMAGVACWGVRTISIEFPDVGTAGASVFKTCRIGSVRVNDADGTCEIPFQVIPDELLNNSWAANYTTYDRAAPPVLPISTFEAELDTPSAPNNSLTVTYPDASKELRVRISSVATATTAEAVYRTYTGDDPNAWQSMTEENFGGTYPYAHAAVDGVGIKMDFRLRNENAAGESSHFSSIYGVTTSPEINTATAASTLAVVRDVNDWDCTVDDINDWHVASMKLAWRTKPGGGSWTSWTTPVSNLKIGPGHVLTHTITYGLTAAESIQIAAATFTSDGTQTDSNFFDFTEAP